MGNQASGDWNDFSSFNPFNQQEHYHPYCEINDFNNQTEVTSFSYKCWFAIMYGRNQLSLYVVWGCIALESVY